MYQTYNNKRSITHNNLSFFQIVNDKISTNEEEEDGAMSFGVVTETKLEGGNHRPSLSSIQVKPVLSGNTYFHNHFRSHFHKETSLNIFEHTHTHIYYNDFMYTKRHNSLKKVKKIRETEKHLKKYKYEEKKLHNILSTIKHSRAIVYVYIYRSLHTVFR